MELPPFCHSVLRNAILCFSLSGCTLQFGDLPFLVLSSLCLDSKRFPPCRLAREHIWTSAIVLSIIKKITIVIINAKFSKSNQANFTCDTLRRKAELCQLSLKPYLML